MPRKFLTTLILCSLPLFMTGTAGADWLDKLKDTAKELTDKAGEVIKEAEPEAPTTSDGEDQVKKPATAAAPSQPAAPTAKEAAKPVAPAAAAVTGNNDKTLVMATQKELKRLGYKIGVDGAYGPNTRKQITSFQISKGITATGDVSPDLLATLKATPTQPAVPAATAASETKAEPEKMAEPAPEPAKAETKAAAAPKASDYDRFYQYEGSAEALKGAWLIIRDKADPLRFYGEIRGDELITRQDLRDLKPGPDAKMGLRGLVSGPFRKTGSYDPPSVVILRFDGIEITARNISNGGSANLTFQAKGSEIAKLLNHLQDGNNFDYRLDHFEPFEYSKDWTAFHTPSPEIAAAKKAKEEAAAEAQAAQQAAQKAAQEKSAAYAATLTPEAKIIFEGCEKNPNVKDYYSCSCMAEQAPAHVDREAAKRVKSLEPVIGGFEASIRKNEENTKLSKAQVEKTNNYLREKIKKAKQDIALFQGPPSDWDDETRRQVVQSVELQLYKEPICKIPDGMREKEYGACMSSPSSSKVAGKTAEEYCGCSAGKAAELWTGSTQAYSSKVAVGIPVQARQACRK